MEAEGSRWPTVPWPWLPADPNGGCDSSTFRRSHSTRFSQRFRCRGWAIGEAPPFVESPGPLACIQPLAAPPGRANRRSGTLLAHSGAIASNRSARRRLGRRAVPTSKPRRVMISRGGTKLLPTGSDTADASWAPAGFESMIAHLANAAMSLLCPIARVLARGPDANDPPVASVGPLGPVVPTPHGALRRCSAIN